MWQTPKGLRTLKGAEAALIRASLGYVADLVEIEGQGNEPWLFNIPLFDQLGWPQKLVLLARVGAALLSDDAAPELDAIHEAAVGVLYRNVSHCLQIEIDSHDDSIAADGVPYASWRTLVRNAWQEVEGNSVQALEEFECPNPESIDLDDWDILVVVLQDQVLWDEDWGMDDLFMDLDPAVSRRRKHRLGIPDDYYTGIVADPDEAALSVVRSQLRALTAE